MKRFLFIAAVTAATLTTTASAADVGVSINIGQPGFYGQIDIGNFPQPQVINVQPIVIGQVPMDRPPIYLRVPAKYRKHWNKHCHEYNACGERVFFVNDTWYNSVYVPHYQEIHRAHPEERHDEHRDEHMGDHHENHGEEHHEHDHDH